MPLTACGCPPESLVPPAVHRWPTVSVPPLGSQSTVRGAGWSLQAITVGISTIDAINQRTARQSQELPVFLSLCPIPCDIGSHPDSPSVKSGFAPACSSFSTIAGWFLHTCSQHSGGQFAMHSRVHASQPPTSLHGAAPMWHIPHRSLQWVDVAGAGFVYAGSEALQRHFHMLL